MALVPNSVGLLSIISSMENTWPLSCTPKGNVLSQTVFARKPYDDVASIRDYPVRAPPTAAIAASAAIASFQKPTSP